MTAVVLLIGVLAATQGWLSGGASTSAKPSPNAQPSPQTADSGGSSSVTPTETESASETESANATASASSTTATEPSPSDGTSAAQQSLADCQARVRAADETLQAAEQGIKHWSEHVQAQTDANAGKISVPTMDAIFKRTRLAGPDDVKRYEDAVEAADQQSGSCSTPPGATAAQRHQLTSCTERSKAQQPVLAAAEDGMHDWKSHLAAMTRSRMGHVHDAQAVWIRAWQAAPPHIEAFEQADQDFDAPRC